jgi:hypothetical protein
MKVLTINGCRDCPYAKSMSREGLLDIFTCNQMKVKIALRYEKTIHPDCKLPDLPKMGDVKNSYVDATFPVCNKNGTASYCSKCGNVLNCVEKS